MRSIAATYLFVFLFFAILGCNAKPEKVTNKKDYENYLNQKENKRYQSTLKSYEFWTDKYKNSPNQFPYLAKIAGAENQLFSITGKIDYLKKAEKHLLTAIKKTNYTISSYLRALAHNYISQHRFQEALNLLKKAEQNGDNLAVTHKMLFDVNMELGKLKAAEKYLSTFVDSNDFGYLIRLAKWQDHHGNTDKAIISMEKAKKIAESSNNKDLKQWLYTNIADFYGHTGRIKDSYNHYLKALALNPNAFYALKGIAWIVYSYEDNPKEALRILNTIQKEHISPSYKLLLSEIYDYVDNKKKKQKNIAAFLKEVNQEKYGDMYNKYKVLLYCNELNKPDLALQIAKEEVKNRATAQSYTLLAWSNYSKGRYDTALTIAKEHIYNKTYEPQLLYYVAKICKANKLQSKKEELKKALNGSFFELGPLMANKIKQL